MDREKILEEIIAMSSYPTLRENEFTAQDYVDGTGISRQGANGRLSRLVTQGILETGMRTDPRTSKVVRAWWKTLDKSIEM